jgi:hypothetical protein
VLAAIPAILLVLHATSLLLLVLGGGVIPALAVGAFKGDDISHGNLVTLVRV